MWCAGSHHSFLGLTGSNAGILSAPFWEKYFHGRSFKIIFFKKFIFFNLLTLFFLTIYKRQTKCLSKKSMFKYSKIIQNCKNEEFSFEETCFLFTKNGNEKNLNLLWHLNPELPTKQNACFVV